MVSAKLPGAVTVLGLGVAVMPDGEVAETLTMPAKPARLPTFTVVEPEVPAGILTLDGVADTVKSGLPTSTVTLTSCVGTTEENTPSPVAVTTTVEVPVAAGPTERLAG